MNLWFWQNPQHSGIFNCGTGRAEPFQNVAEAVIKHHQKGAIEYIPFPDHLKGSLPELHPGRPYPRAASVMTASSRQWPKAWPITWLG